MFLELNIFDYIHSQIMCIYLIQFYCGNFKVDLEQILIKGDLRTRNEDSADFSDMYKVTLIDILINPAHCI